MTMATPQNLDRQVVDVYTWAASAARKRIKRVSIPAEYKDAAQHIADEGNGFRFDGSTLTWD